MAKSSKRPKTQNKVFIYWDDSNIFIGARDVAVEKHGEEVRYRVRINFKRLLELAKDGRKIGHAVAAGSIPPELRNVWNRLANEGVKVELLERGKIGGGEQGVDQILQTAMLRDAFDNNGNPATAVLLTGDGAGFEDGVGFHADLERMRKRGWKVEVISWQSCCNVRMKKWAEKHGKFTALDDFFDEVTFFAPENYNYIASMTSDA